MNGTLVNPTEKAKSTVLLPLMRSGMLGPFFQTYRIRERQEVMRGQILQPTHFGTFMRPLVSTKRVDYPSLGKNWLEFRVRDRRAQPNVVRCGNSLLRYIGAPIASSVGLKEL